MIDMELKIGDVVEFKKYEDMTEDEISCIAGKYFPKSGKITKIRNDGFFTVEYSGYVFNPESVARVISDVGNYDLGVIRKGDEVLVKATIKDTFNGFVELIPLVKKTDVTKILKRKEPEHFIVQEDHYGMYIGTARKLVSDKTEAKIYTSRNTANNDAADMHLNAWDVIHYDD